VRRRWHIESHYNGTIKDYRNVQFEANVKVEYSTPSKVTKLSATLVIQVVSEEYIVMTVVNGLGWFGASIYFF